MMLVKSYAAAAAAAVSASISSLEDPMNSMIPAIDVIIGDTGHPVKMRRAATGRINAVPTANR